MAENEKKNTVLMSETANAGAVQEGIDAGVKALSSRSVHRALNTKQSVFAESAEKLFDKVHPAGKKK